MKKRALFALLLCLAPLSACSSDGDQGPQFTEDPFTVADMDGVVLMLVPDTPVGGIERWEYEFTGSTVKGCNIERVYNATGWQLIDSRTVRVQFGGQWEQYELVNYTGRVATGDLRGTFNYSSSPGVTMTGTLAQQSSTVFC